MLCNDYKLVVVRLIHFQMLLARSLSHQCCPSRDHVGAQVAVQVEVQQLRKSSHICKWSCRTSSRDTPPPSSEEMFDLSEDRCRTCCRTSTTSEICFGAQDMVCAPVNFPSENSIHPPKFMYICGYKNPRMSFSKIWNYAKSAQRMGHGTHRIQCCAPLPLFQELAELLSTKAQKKPLSTLK